MMAYCLVDMARESMQYDVVIVGAGPAGLSSAIKLKQLCSKNDVDLSVCVVEKGAEVGAHILSGNVFEPRALNELIPDWKEKEAPLYTPVKEDKFVFLTEKAAVPLPTPPQMHNEGNYIISLSNLTKWLASQAEELGVEIYPGFSASEVLYRDDGSVYGIATRDTGIDKQGNPKSTFTRGMELHARQTLLAEGCRGSCSEEVMKKFNLRENADPQTYGLGLKEIWQIDPAKFKSGFAQHTIGWPLCRDTYGGSFLYHMDTNLVLLGFVIGLDYKNPYLNPYMEFQRFKTHPLIRQTLEGGECISYGARCLNEGGFQSIPKLTFPGGALIGCSAGFLNVPKIKGTHTAMKSGMVAAESVFKSLISQADSERDQALEVADYQTSMEKSWVWEELKKVRNIHPSFSKGLLPGLVYSGFSTYITRGLEPWTFRHSKTDSESTKKASECSPIEYPKPDGVLTFDILDNLTRSNVNHEHDQPAHLRVKPEKAHIPVDISYQEYAAPESRFCPAKVYEYTTDSANPQLVINAQNCVHCKCCSIKTPEEYINWTVPEGAGGPAYVDM